MRRPATLTRSAVVAAAILLFLCGRADAASKCTVSTTSISFGTYNVFGTNPSDSTGTVTYNCSGDTVFVWITLDSGGGGSFSPRTLQRINDQLSYNLYRDAAHSVIWGNGSGGTSIYYDDNPPHKTNVDVTIYGRIQAGQDVRAGTYTDTVTVVVNF